MDEALTKPRNVTHTMYKLYGWLQTGVVDLSPEFQRDVVWPITKQSHLIDSVLNNYYIPPVIFSCKILDDNRRWVRVCIDGKQRLTAIKNFMDNKISHINPAIGIKSKRFYNDPNHTSLTEAEREIFDCSELLCVEYYDLSLQQEQEIFSRVQLGVALTPAEKLQAISSPMSDFVHAVYNKYSTLSSIVDNKRARPFQLIAQSLHMIETKPEKFNATPITIAKYLKEDREVPRGLKALIKHVYTIIEDMIKVNTELFHRNHKLSPVEFVFLTYMIAKLPKLQIYQYQKCLLSMREHVWDKHDEVRFNSKVFNTLKVFIDNLEYEFTSNHKINSKNFNPSSNIYDTSASSSSRGSSSRGLSSRGSSSRGASSRGLSSRGSKRVKISEY
ncbi:unnamed protein product [Rhizophagus irregularis]|uniref:GmrSD restriction endonucleases N-terminal domain-containing protein n=1 Tax=Rhizophagus irregularis TaxID=588596 RepID=A0A2I1H173_9GLOM|nr:hypothetical protein RhiirA4_497044 [Rhizophagus irregularis]CAB4404778.1 unnamed protein product [Rhizophagus irregularis]